MADQQLISSYLNELAWAVQELRESTDCDVLHVPLEDGYNSVLTVRTWSDGRRVTGRIQGQRGRSEFELRIRPRQLEYRHPKAGVRGTLRSRVDQLAIEPGPKDTASRVALLARRLQHFSILKCIREGIRSERAAMAS